MKTEFTDDQYSSAYSDGVENHWWNLVRNDLISRLVRKLPIRQPKIMEIGCGRGMVVNYLRKHGVNCFGVELAPVKPVPEIAQHVRSATSALDVPADERSTYEVVMMLDVLEHLPNPRAFIDSVVSAYPNARSIIVTVPARAELWSNYDEHYGHFLRYSSGNLSQLMRSCGLSIASIGYFFHSVYPVALAAAKLSKGRPVEISAPLGLMRWIHKIVSYVLTIDARLLPGNIPGTSLYAVCDIPRSASAKAS